MSKAHILFADDDLNIQKVVKQYLEDDGHIVDTASNGAECLDILKNKKDDIDIILLDMVLPDYDGLTLLRECHEISKAPIIVVSGKGDAADKVVGLEMGADDYLVKPFHLRELSARIKTVLRRADHQSHPPSKTGAADDQNNGQAVHQTNAAEASKSHSEPEQISFNGWTMNCRKYEVIAPDGTSVPFTSGEFEMLLTLAQSAHIILSRERLFEVTRGIESESYDRAVDIQIGRLRKKLGDDPKNPAFIKTVRGVGYMFIADVTKK